MKTEYVSGIGLSTFALFSNLIPTLSPWSRYYYYLSLEMRKQDFPGSYSKEVSRARIWILMWTIPNPSVYTFPKPIPLVFSLPPSLSMLLLLPGTVNQNNISIIKVSIKITAAIGWWICSRHCAKHAMCIVSSNPPNNPMR